MKRLALGALVFVATPARADVATAEVAYQQAEAMVKQGRWTDACPLYDASYRADPQLGVLLHLADCHEHVGMNATAWAEFNDAVELAHRRGDAREAYAAGRADTIKPKLAKLHLSPPPQVVPGLVVRRDGVDITVLVGTDIAIDPGAHEVVATAPGFLEWRHQLTIGVLATVTSIDIPQLEKQPEHVVAPAAPDVHEGTLRVTTAPGAVIELDDHQVAVGHYEAKLPSGEHRLHVAAPGMRPFESELVIQDNEVRSIDVPLERDVAIATPVAVEPPGPGLELGVSVVPGVKLRADRPAVLAYRADLGFFKGRRTRLGFYVQYGTIDASGSCGTDIAGPSGTGPFDFGERNRFLKCQYVTPGLELLVHVLPKRRWDPYAGISPGFRFGFYKYDQYDATGALAQQRNEIMPAVVVGGNVGVDYHPTESFAGWVVGVAIDAELTAFGQEQASNASHSSGTTYLSLYGGLRTAVAF